jgi:hypothetical protein
VELHLGSKGFFTEVFINLEDRDRIFEGGPYFHASAELYMQPWKENFSPEKETFKKVSVWLRLYSLTLDYWLPSTLEAIGNKLGKYIKTAEATLRGRYTSYARICIEMDVSGALPSRSYTVADGGIEDSRLGRDKGKTFYVALYGR